MTKRSYFPYCLEEADIASLIAEKGYQLSKYCKARLEKINTRYDFLEKEERDNLILQILQYLGSDIKARTGEENLAAFEKGWTEVYEKCLAEGVSFAALRPQYVTKKSLQYFRLNGDYVVSENPYLVDELINLILEETFAVYLHDMDNIYEFGCGTGQYLFLMSEMYPRKNLYGTDWTRASQKILEVMAQENRSVRGYHFDMINPDYSLKLQENSAVITIAALEQLSTDFDPFLEYILAQKPKRVIHHEPIEELFQDNLLLDYLGLQYHKKREYLSGYLTRLQEYERNGLLKIQNVHRIKLGNQYCEAITRIVWEPA